MIQIDKEKTFKEHPRPSVSCAMILKDESEYLDKAIATSAHMIDELIVGIDNTSSDSTEKIAQKWVDKIGGQLYYFDWGDDFSALRNEGIEKCTKDWVFILDGHEYFDEVSQARLVGLFEAAGSKAQAITIRVRNVEAKTTLFQVRFFKAGMGTKFEDKVHNKLVGDSIRRVSSVQNVLLIHERTQKAGSARKKQRNEMVYRIMLEEHRKDPNNPRALHYLARQCLDSKNYRDSEKYHKMYLKFVKDPIEKHVTIWNLSHALANQAKYAEAITYLWEAVKVYDGLPHAYVELGLLIHTFRKDATTAIKLYRKAMQRSKPPMCHISMAYGPFTWIPWFQLGMTYRDIGDIKRAAAAFRIAIQFDDISYEALSLLWRICGKDKSLPTLKKRLDETRLSQVG